MASPSTSYSEIVTTTLRRRNKELTDNMMNGNFLLKHLSKNGNVKTTPGGRVIVEELEYAENDTFKFYSGYEVLDIQPSDVISAAEYSWKQAAVNVTASGLETVVQNSGPEAVINLLTARIKNAMKTMENKLSEAVYSDGTGYSGKQIGGLKHLVPSDPTSGSVGTINRATWSFWRNQYLQNASMSASNIQGDMRTLWLRCKRGTDTPKIGIADDYAYTYYWESLSDLQRFNRDDTANAGWDTLKFKGMEIAHDGDSGIADYYLYFLNTDYIYLRPHSDRFIVPLDERNPVNQDAFLIPVLFAGNMSCSNCARQGILFKS